MGLGNVLFKFSFKFILITGILAVTYSSTLTSNSMEFKITQTWDGDIPSDAQEIFIKFTPTNGTFGGHLTSGLRIDINAPFYDDPKLPEGTSPGTPVDNLWNYEVVEAFFLGPDNKYLEVELGPHGNYLVLTLQGTRKAVDFNLPLEDFKTYLEDTEYLDKRRWIGSAFIPKQYFPNPIEKFNAYAIHKSNPEKVYMSLWPTPKGKYEKPDFHRLEYFKEIDLQL